MFTFLRLGLACVFFALSLLTFFPAPTVWLWVVTIAVTEYGHWFALVMLVLLIGNLWIGWGLVKNISSALFLSALFLFSLPVMEAIPLARHLPGDLTKSFGSRFTQSGLPSYPIEFAKLWGFPRPAGVQLKVFHYTTQDGISLALDFYSNGAPGAQPCLVIVHGGAWQVGNEEELSYWNPILAQLGYRVASIAYRLAPKSRWPAQKQDLVAALAYLKANASLLGIDPNQFALLGRSAGAQIILATAYSSHDSSIRGCIACYSPTDMVFDYGTGHSLLDAHQIFAQFLGGKPGEIPDLYRDASPLQLAGPDSPPTLLAHGTRDELVWIENSRRLRDRLVQIHRPVYLLEMPWATHGFDANPYGPGGQLGFYAITWFLGSVFSTSK